MIWLALIVIFAGVVSWAIRAHLRQKRAEAPYRARPCAGIRWRRAFPDATASEIGDFLDTVSDCLDLFLCSDSKRVFRPTDTVLELYHIHSPPGSFMDDMELERLALAAEDKYGIDIWKEPFCDWTLGELFRRLRAPNA
ncbi:MAG: hypothetical protein AAF916_12660 [Planctomycetota bacterium]